MTTSTKGSNSYKTVSSQYRKYLKIYVIEYTGSQKEAWCMHARTCSVCHAAGREMWHTQKAAGAGQLTFLPRTAPVVTWYMSCSFVEEI